MMEVRYPGSLLASLHREWTALLSVLGVAGCVTQTDAPAPAEEHLDRGTYDAIVTPHDVPRLIVRRQAPAELGDDCSYVHFLGLSERDAVTGELPFDWDLDAVCLVAGCDDDSVWEACTEAEGIRGWLSVTDGDFPTTVSLDLTVTANTEVRFVAEDLLVAEGTTFDAPPAR
jgi:hypothetical protein